MLLQESEQLLRRSIDGHLFRMDVFLLEHVVEQLPTQSAALSRLVHVEIQHAGRRHIHRLAILVEHVQGFAADFQNAHDQSTMCLCVPTIPRQIGKGKGKAKQRTLEF